MFNVRASGETSTDRPNTIQNNRWPRILLILTMAYGLFVVFFPLATECSLKTDGAESCRRVALIFGADAPIAVAIAVGLVALGLLPLFAGRTGAMVAAVLLTALSVISMASIGLLLLPLVAVAWVTVARFDDGA